MKILNYRKIIVVLTILFFQFSIVHSQTQNDLNDYPALFPSYFEGEKVHTFKVEIEHGELHFSINETWEPIWSKDFPCRKYFSNKSSLLVKKATFKKYSYEEVMNLIESQTFNYLDYYEGFKPHESKETRERHQWAMIFLSFIESYAIPSSNSHKYDYSNVYLFAFGNPSSSEKIFQVQDFCPTQDELIEYRNNYPIFNTEFKAFQHTLKYNITFHPKQREIFEFSDKEEMKRYLDLLNTVISSKDQQELWNAKNTLQNHRAFIPLRKFMKKDDMPSEVLLEWMKLPTLRIVWPEPTEPPKEKQFHLHHYGALHFDINYNEKCCVPAKVVDTKIIEKKLVQKPAGNLNVSEEQKAELNKIAQIEQSVDAKKWKTYYYFYMLASQPDLTKPIRISSEETIFLKTGLTKSQVDQFLVGRDGYLDFWYEFKGRWYPKLILNQYFDTAKNPYETESQKEESIKSNNGNIKLNSWNATSSGEPTGNIGVYDVELTIEDPSSFNGDLTLLFDATWLESSDLLSQDNLAMATCAVIPDHEIPGDIDDDITIIVQVPITGICTGTPTQPALPKGKKWLTKTAKPSHKEYKEILKKPKKERTPVQKRKKKVYEHDETVRDVLIATEELREEGVILEELDDYAITPEISYAQWIDWEFQFDTSILSGSLQDTLFVEEVFDSTFTEQWENATGIVEKDMPKEIRNEIEKDKSTFKYNLAAIKQRIAVTKFNSGTRPDLSSINDKSDPKDKPGVINCKNDPVLLNVSSAKQFDDLQLTPFTDDYIFIWNSIAPILRSGLDDYNYYLLFNSTDNVNDTEKLVSTTDKECIMTSVFSTTKSDPFCTTCLNVNEDELFELSGPEHFNGVCGAITTIHSLQRLGLSAQEALENRRAPNFTNDAFINRWWINQLMQGQPAMRINRLIANHKLCGLKICCTNDESGNNKTGNAINNHLKSSVQTNNKGKLGNFNRNLSALVNERKNGEPVWDCSLILKLSHQDGKGGHVENIESMTLENTTYIATINTKNSMEQGDKERTVPINSGFNSWQIHPNNTEVTYQSTNPNTNQDKYDTFYHENRIYAIKYVCCKK